VKVRWTACETGSASASLAGAGGVPAAEDNIARFCEDLTAKAAAGCIDPIFGAMRFAR
jgi:type VI secretion system protein VasG